jgi:cardiolipin synthase
MVWAFATDSTWIYLFHPLIVLLFALRIIWVRRPPGVAMAWILIVAIMPIVGISAYLLIGERPIGRERRKRMHEIAPAYIRMTELFDVRFPETTCHINEKFRAMAVLAENHGGMPPVPGNALTLYSDAQTILHGMIDDIDAAQSRCDVEFYIWNPGGTADLVGEALIRAAARGVACRVLLDELGSSTFFKSAWPKRLKSGGVQLVKACAIHPLRLQFGRADLRLHRKIVAIDQHIAWTGSLNLVDPAFFKQDAGVGEWIDAMTRVVGPGAASLTTIFEGDWAIETGNIAGFIAFLDQMHATPVPPAAGALNVQVVPTGPSYKAANMSHMLLSAVLDARKEVVLTTPYFVPDEALFQALQTAACRGVDVTLIVPQRVDSTLVRYASRSYMADLLNAGVKIQQFTGGLLHTKSLVVDHEFTIFGSVNLDMRSLRLNYEITLMIYDAGFSQQVRALQDQYLARSIPIDPASWSARPLSERLKENAAQLMAPLL